MGISSVGKSQFEHDYGVRERNEGIAKVIEAYAEGL